MGGKRSIEQMGRREEQAIKEEGEEAGNEVGDGEAGNIG